MLDNLREKKERKINKTKIKIERREREKTQQTPANLTLTFLT